MPKKLECIIPGCDATIEAETEELVMAQVETHAKKAHPEMDLDRETIDSIRANIEDE
ncbi:DUF1059 domain-containing protein [Haloarchaeobius sp. TZWWS8]|uniref:DUF1059 domain-containing protein n=1 Tax=Haloarchaeobius sp. TZWWS8 TaxID=3446121 RepID=UPI003EBA5092